VAEDNIEIVRAGMAAVDRDDWDAVFELLDPEIEWGYQPAHPEVPSFHGHEGVREFLSLFAEAWEEYRFEPEELIEAGDSVVVAGRERGRPRGGGAEVDQEVFAVWTLRDGKAVSYRLYTERQEALQAAAGLKD
jgi:ketosteroid isomerase-like protein